MRKERPQFDPKPLAPLAFAAVGATVAMFLANKAAGAAFPLAAHVAAALATASGIGVNLASNWTSRLAWEGRPPRDWLASEDVAHVVTTTIAEIIDEYAKDLQNVESDAQDDRFLKLAQAVSEDWRVWDAAIIETLGSFHESDIPAQFLAPTKDWAATSCGDEESWIALLRHYPHTAVAGADNQGVATFFTPEELRPLAQRLRAAYLETFSDVLNRPEHETAYRKILLKVMGEGFSRLTRLAGEHDSKLREALGEIDDLRSRIETLAVPSIRPQRIGGSAYAFQRRRVDFVGREREKALIHRFAQDEEHFRWWRVVGPAGAGKSRFALEMIDLAREEGWLAGWIDWDHGSLDAWRSWAPRTSTLLVMDYALDHAERAAEIIDVLTHRAEGFNGIRVRLLAIARESGVRWSSMFSGGRGEALRSSLWIDNPSEALEGLEESAEEFRPGSFLALPEIGDHEAHAILKQAWEKTLKGAPYNSVRAGSAVARLHGTEGTHQPLYLQFVGEALAKGQEERLGDYSREALTKYVLEREMERWMTTKVTLPYANLAMLACIHETVECRPVPPAIPSPGGGPVLPEAVERERLSACLSLSNSVASDHGFVACKFEPDVLGEIYVLLRLNGGRPFDLDLAHAPAHARAVLGYACPPQDSCEPEAVARRDRAFPFLARAFDSFPELAAATGLARGLDDPDRLLLQALDVEQRLLADEEVEPSKWTECRSLARNVSDPSARALWAYVALRGFQRTESPDWLEELRSLARAYPEPEALTTFAQALSSAHARARAAQRHEDADGLLTELRALAERHEGDSSVKGYLDKAGGELSFWADFRTSPEPHTRLR